jgi:flagellar basal-body rod modification protein FlgD
MGSSSILSTAAAGSNTTAGSTNSQLGINQQIAGNFNQFLQLLTVQLQNQNPMDPLDTNQFTQQLVQFASVEQQINMNTNLQTLVSLQQSAQNTQALGYVGKTVTVSGSNAAMVNGNATWQFNPTVPANATFTITDSTGQTVYQKTGTVQPGQQQFSWDGTDMNGNKWADGNYKLTITATGANGQSVGIPTTVSGVVSSVDLTQSPPLLSIGGQTYTLDQILTVTDPASITGSVASAASNAASAAANTVTNAASSLINGVSKIL